MSAPWVTDEAFCDWLISMRYGKRVEGGPIKLFVTMGLCLYMHEAWVAALSSEAARLSGPGAPGARPR